MQGWGKVKQAAKYAGISERTLRSWLKNGLKHSRVPTILIRYSDIDEWIDGFSVNNDDRVDRIVDDVCKDLN